MKKSRLLLIPLGLLTIGSFLSGCATSPCVKYHIRTKEACKMFIWKNYTKNKGKHITAFFLKYKAKRDLKDSLQSISKFKENVLPVKPKRFGYNYLQLRQIVFNIADTSYYSKIEPAAAGVCNQFGNGKQIPTASGTIVAEYERFLNITNNTAALYSIVNGYYVKALSARFGTLKTSFLKDAGIGIDNDISYDTVLKNTNDFLNYIHRNNQNQSRFETLFNVTFQKWHKKQNYICDIGRFAPGIRSLESFYTPSRQTVNFYSVDYYLLRNIYNGKGKNKEFSKKLFADIVLRKFQKAYDLLNTIYAPSGKSNNNSNPFTTANFIQIAKTGYSKNNIVELKKIMVYWEHQYKINPTTNKFSGAKAINNMSITDLTYDMQDVIYALQSLHDVALKNKSAYRRDFYNMRLIDYKELQAEMVSTAQLSIQECRQEANETQRKFEIGYTPKPCFFHVPYIRPPRY